MLIVLEGLPGTGKSRFLNSVAINKKFNTIPEVIDPLEDENEVFFLQNDLKKYQRVVSNRINIMDRNFVSTLCYNYCKDKQSDTKNYKKVEHFVNENLNKQVFFEPDLYIVLTCTVSTSLKRQNKTNDTLWQDKLFLQNVKKFYTDYFTNKKMYVLFIDTDSYSVNDVYLHIMCVFKEMKVAAK